jgi:hypothetical protein
VCKDLLAECPRHLSPTYDSKVARWIIQEARERFFSAECGAIELEGLILLYDLWPLESGVYVSLLFGWILI